ncbi:unnamed protein product [Adineta steineri]|uniref:EF-hand domain-containing protein n=1 Tax=Adineta steineri TaxID=433720 RepID=A0A820A1M8_9BILA|nr:unnamed protein product [Adineta steineri]CAF3979617.1 unnamed protein product [Adineta steineri]CAF4186117.1 unnamed protein product [Adineta steineri]
MDTHIVNTLERRLGMDLNGDGYIGGEGYLAQLERATGRDINGDGILGRRPDVVPGFPAVHGHPSMVYGQSGQIYATNNFVAPRTQTGYSPYSTNPYSQYSYTHHPYSHQSHSYHRHF